MFRADLPIATTTSSNDSAADYQDEPEQRNAPVLSIPKNRSSGNLLSHSSSNSSLFGDLPPPRSRLSVDAGSSSADYDLTRCVFSRFGKANGRIIGLITCNDGMFVSDGNGYTATCMRMRSVGKRAIANAHCRNQVAHTSARARYRSPSHKTASAASKPFVPKLGCSRYSIALRFSRTFEKGVTFAHDWTCVANSALQ